MTRQLIISVLMCGGFIVANADQPPPAALTADEAAVAGSISQKQVLSTVSFLSSDEMAGRNTPSTELTIASAFVAARFRGAGLEGLGEKGSFFQVHKFRVSKPPTNGVSVRDSDGNEIILRGLLTAGNTDVSEDGIAQTEAAALKAEDSGIVVVDELIMPPQAVSRPSLVIASLARRLRGVTKTGAKVVLMRCGEESVLPEIALKLAQQPIPNAAGLRPECPVILISEVLDLTDQQLSISVPAQEVSDVPVRNVVGVLRGSDEKLAHEAILVSAHLDHIGTRDRGDDLINNGADDNATGVTTVVTLADAFSSLAKPPRRSIVFATFWGEEKGLLGSKEFVKQPLWPLQNIVANVNIEMVGRPEPDAREKAWMTGWGHSNLGPMMNAGAMRVGIEIFDRPDVGEMLYSRSDNYPFVQKGVVAHSFSAGSLHSDYHQPGDEWEKLDLPHMTRVIEGLFAGVLYISDSDVSVEATEK